jgi:hypothetical protein
MKRLRLLLIVLALASCAPQPTPEIVEVTVPVEVTVLVTQPPKVVRETVLVTQPPKAVEVTVVVTRPPLPTYTPYPTYTPVPKPAFTPEPTATPTLEVVQPADARASAYIGGNESPSLPGGEMGLIAVVAVGPYDGNTLPIVVRNNTRDDVIRVAISAVARDKSGNMLGSGGDQGFNPNLVRPGEITLGYVYFGGIDLPDDATFEFETSADLASDARFENIRDLDVVEQSFVEDRIVGMLQNSHDEHVSGPIEAMAFCFSPEGTLLDFYRNYTDKDEAGPGKTVPFQVDVRGDCPVFLIAANGYAD